MKQTALSQFNIQLGGELTMNVQPLLHEIRHALMRLLDQHKNTIIDLRSIPLAPGEEDRILEALGSGEVHAQLNALGRSEISETSYAGIWRISHFNEANELISRFIEITTMPDILKSQPEDMADALERLTQALQTDETAHHVETDS